MNKEEILEKSRKENKGQDKYEEEIIGNGHSVGIILASILATIFYVIQIMLGEGSNLSLYAIIGAFLSGIFITKAIKLKRKHEIITAIIYVVLTLACTITHIYQLINLSTIL